MSDELIARIDELDFYSGCKYCIRNRHNLSLMLKRENAQAKLEEIKLFREHIECSTFSLNSDYYDNKEYLDEREKQLKGGGNE